MQDLEKIVFYMKEEINKQADAECEAIMEQVRKITADEEEKIKEEAQKDAKLHLDAAMKKLQSEKALAISKFSSEKTKTLIEKREEYTQMLFNEVKEKLLAFAKSEDYPKYMQKKISDYSFDKKVNVFVRKEDMSLKGLFEKQFDCNLIEADIEIGGFRIETEDQKIVDETLDARLKDQRGWFEDHSLMIL